jgi:AraC-like DNA-binding protein
VAGSGLNRQFVTYLEKPTVEAHAMIIANLKDPLLRAAVTRAAHAEEDVILNPTLALEAMEFGYPRLVVQTASDAAPQPFLALEANVPTLVVPRATLAGWEVERRSRHPQVAPLPFLAERMRTLVDREASSSSWVDRALGELGRAAGAPLQPALRSFGRRVLEFPSHYVDLYPLAEACGVSRGALKARFRRRDLPSPYTYLRWFRMIACAYVLSDRRVTVAQAATRLGFTSDGNLCRAMLSLTGMTPTEVRTFRGWTRLLITFAWKHLGAESRAAWGDLNDLFLRRVA